MNLLNIILSSLFTSFLTVFIFKNISKSKLNLKKFLIFFLIMFILLIPVTLWFSGMIKMILIVLVITIAAYFSFFNKSLMSALYYTIVYEVLVFIIEMILSLIYVSIFNYNIESYNNFSLSLLLFSVSNSTILFLISLIKKLSDIITNFYKRIINKKYEIIYVLFILFILSLLLYFNKNNLGKDLTFYINAGMIIFVFVTFVFIIYRDFQNEYLEKNYNEMMEYVQKYEKIINDQGKKNHEYNNQLMVIKGYSHNPKKLEEYLNLIINEHKCGQNYTIRELSYFPDGGIKGLIYHKISKMEENDIKYYLFVDKNIKNVFEDKLDLKTYQDITKLLGIFLDNAIEATMLSNKKEVEIDFKKQDDCIIMDISNTFNNKTDIKQIGKRGFTTKGFGHGYGLSIVKDINKHNKKIETFNDIDDDKFKQTTIIYYK